MAHGHGAGHQADHASGRVFEHAPGPAVALDGAALEALLSAAVLRGHRVDNEAEQRAVAAFRAARDAGAHRARTRRRDDWRPREQRRLARSVKTALSLFVASLTLGGVAFAAIGSSDTPDASPDDKVGTTPTAGAPDRPAANPSAEPGTSSGKPGNPATAQDTEAKCRAYEQVDGRGSALDSTAWQRLVTEAGGADKVAAYCAQQLAAAADAPGRTADPNGAADNGQDQRDASGAGASGSDASESGASGSGTGGSGTSESGTGGSNAGGSGTGGSGTGGSGTGAAAGSGSGTSAETGKKN
ncbi:hypothetical protein ACIBAG_42635 [Streptomyces sp. NPDC051243]|uniref:hypothetical protein n=1 Tax=Streptomyces sp. NPDC051243 TaxID=3365646 RepID=UPI0037A830B1